MKEYLARRQLIVVSLNDLSDRTSFDSLVYFQLPVNQRIDLQDIDEVMTKALHGHDGYTIDDIRKKFEHGASDAFQEVILNVLAGTVGGISSEFLKPIYSWAKKKIKKTNKNTPSNDKAYFNKVTEVFERYTDLEIADIKVLPSSNLVEKFLIRSKQESHYAVEILDEGSRIEIKRIDDLSALSFEEVHLDETQKIYKVFNDSLNLIINSIKTPSENQILAHQRFMESLNRLVFRL